MYVRMGGSSIALYVVWMYVRTYVFHSLSVFSSWNEIKQTILTVWNSDLKYVQNICMSQYIVSVYMYVHDKCI